MRQPTHAWSRLEIRNRGMMGKIGSQWKYKLFKWRAYRCIQEGGLAPPRHVNPLISKHSLKRQMKP